MPRLKCPGLRVRQQSVSAQDTAMKTTACCFTVLLSLLAAQAHADLVFAVNEGVTYKVPNTEIRARYTAIAADLSKLLKQPVAIEPIADYPTLRKGLTDKAYDLAMVHPAHVSINAIKNSGYQLLVVTKGFENYRANFLVNATSPLKTLADLKGSKIGAPDEDSITAWMTRAAIRDALGADAKQVSYAYTRYQDAVPFFVENNLTPSGATAAGAVIKAWTAKGGKVLFQSKAVPIKHIIASPKVSAEQVQVVRNYLLTLDTTDEGKAKLSSTRYAGFAAYDDAALMAIGTWLGL
jgi:phosphonate transport system substrate-binding protein